MPHPASPTRIKRTGEWGASVKAPITEVKPGDAIEVTTRAGKQWIAYVYQFIYAGGDFTVVTTSRVPLSDTELEESARTRNKLLPEAEEEIEKAKDRPKHTYLSLEGDYIYLYNVARDPRITPMLKGLMGARWKDDKQAWRFSADPVDRDRIVAVATAAGAEIDPKVLEYEVPPHVVEAVRRAQEAGAYGFQLAGVRFLAWRKKCLFADDMGLGKTFQSLLALPESAKAVVVCPKSLKYNWAAEIKKWRPDLEPVIVHKRGTMKPPKSGQVVIINYDILPSEPPSMPGVQVIFDEAHRFKNRRTKVWKSAKALVENTDGAWALTGTPLTNKPTDLWNILDAIQLAKITFTSWNVFAEKLFHGRKNRFGIYEWGMPDESVSHRLRRVMLRRRKEEVLDELPEKNYAWIEIDIPKKIQVLLDELEGNERAAARLSQSDLPPFEVFSETRRILSEYKAEKLEEWIEDREQEGTKLVVFSAHKKPILRFENREGWGVIHGGVPAEERQRIVDDFQAGKLKGIAGVIQAANVGLTLTAASTVLFISTEWNPAENAQAEDRVRRIGQTASSVTIFRAVTKHPLDRHIENLLLQKQRMIEKAVEKDTIAEAEEIASMLGETLEERREALERTRVDRMVEKEQSRAEDAALTRLSSLGVYDWEEIFEGFTEEQKDAIYTTTRLLANVCDGAVMRDDIGFNATDTRLGRRLGSLPAELWPDEGYVAMYYTLQKYKRQIPTYLQERIYGKAS